MLNMMMTMNYDGSKDEQSKNNLNKNCYERIEFSVCQNRHTCKIVSI